MKNLAPLTILLLIQISLLGCSQGPKKRTYSPYEQETPDVRSPNVDVLKQIQVYYQKGDYQKALQIAESTPEEKFRLNDRAEFWNLKGLSLLALKKPLQAESSFRKAISENKKSEYQDYFNYNLATSLYESKKTAEAFNVLNSIDLNSLDQSHQRKVLSLKEKVSSYLTQTGQSVPTPTPTPEPTIIPSPEASATLPPPGEVYHGPVESSKIGVLLPLSGKYEGFGNRAKRAIEFAFQQSSHGKKIELVIQDSGDTPATHLSALQKLVEEDQVIAVIGPLLSKGIEALVAKAAYYQIPLLSIAQAQGPVSSHLFSCSISSRDQVTQVLDHAVNVLGLKRFAVIAPNNKSGEEFAKIFWDEVEARQGQIKAYEFYNPSDTDFREPVDKALGLFYPEARADELKELARKREELKITKKTMKTAQYYTLPPIMEFDAVFIPDEAKTVGQLIPTFAYRDADKITFMGISSWNSTQLVQRAQNFVEGAFFPVGFNTVSPTNTTQKFIDSFKEIYNGSPGEIEAVAYDSAQIMIQAHDDGASSRDEFREKLERIKNVEGATGSVTMDAHRCSRTLSLFQVEKGKIVPVRN